MFENITLLSIFFRLINLAILIAIFSYLFRRHALDQIKDGMAAEEEFVAGLENQKIELAALGKTEIQNLADQKLLCIELTKKVDTWQAVCNNEHVQREQEKELLLQSLIQKNQQQSDNVAFNSVQRHVLPKVLVKAQTELEALFACEEKGRAYLHQLVKQLEKDQA